MRFHHSTRRGRHHSAPSHYHHSSSSTRWSQLNHCRETNIYFNRRLPVEYSSTPIEIETMIGTIDATIDPITLLSTSTTSKLLNQHDAEIGKEKEKKNDEQKTKCTNETTNNQRYEHEQEQINNLDASELREKLIAQVQKHPFWSNKAAKRMQIKNVKRRNIYIYELESFCERRDLEWNYEPYRGGLSAGTITPYRSYEIPAAAASSSLLTTSSSGICSGRTSVSQPVTPLNHYHQTNISLSGSGHKNQFIWSNGEANKVAATIATATTTTNPQHDLQSSLAGTGSMGSSSSSNKSPLIEQPNTPSHQSLTSSLNKTNSLLSYEPISSRLDHLIPSPESVWSIDVKMGQHNNLNHNHNNHTNHQQQQSRIGRRQLTTPGCISSELPNSSFVKRCHGCQGRGKLKCNSCHGVGYEVCLSCSGKGTTRSYAASSGGRSSASYSRSCDRSSSSYYDRGDSDDYHGGGGGGGIGAGPSDHGNARNSRYANGDSGEQSSSGLGGSLGGWSQESCSTCHGAGQKRCWVCAGKSYNNCPGCAGLGNLRCFLTLTVSWLSHCDDVIINNSDQIIPKERLRICSGILLVDQVADRLGPLNHSIDTTTTTTSTSGGKISSTSSSSSSCSSGCQSNRQEVINNGCFRHAAEREQLHLASKHLIEKHRHTYKGEKFLKQRHKVTQIECQVVRYEWKQRHGQFVIYGEERKVYIGKYPFKSFCNLI